MKFHHDKVTILCVCQEMPSYIFPVELHYCSPDYLSHLNWQISYDLYFGNVNVPIVCYLSENKLV